MTNRSSTIEKAAESPAIKQSIERAKHAEHEGRWAEACAVYESLVRDPDADANTRLAALRWLGRAYLEQGNRGAALDVLEAAVAAADIVGSPPAVAQALNVIGIVYQVGGDLDQAATIYQAARAKAELAADGALIAMIDQNLGTVAMIRGGFGGFSFESAGLPDARTPQSRSASAQQHRARIHAAGRARRRRSCL